MPGLWEVSAAAPSPPPAPGAVQPLGAPPGAGFRGGIFRMCICTPAHAGPRALPAPCCPRCPGRPDPLALAAGAGAGWQGGHTPGAHACARCPPALQQVQRCHPLCFGAGTCSSCQGLLFASATCMARGQGTSGRTGPAPAPQGTGSTAPAGLILRLATLPSYRFVPHPQFPSPSSGSQPLLWCLLCVPLPGAGVRRCPPLAAHKGTCSL